MQYVTKLKHAYPKIFMDGRVNCQLVYISTPKPLNGLNLIFRIYSSAKFSANYEYNITYAFWLILFEKIVLNSIFLINICY